MNALRLAVAAAAFLMLGGAAGAEAVDAGTTDMTKNDPLAVPMSGRDAGGERAAQPWTPERQAKAQAKPTPDVDPAAVGAASERFRSEPASGPEQATAAAVVAAAGGYAPIGSAPGKDGGDYWTPERLRSAKPMPMPELNEEQFRKLITPGQKNR